MWQEAARKIGTVKELGELNVAEGSTSVVRNVASFGNGTRKIRFKMRFIIEIGTNPPMPLCHSVKR